jgi:sulfate adenylyltransferase (ADP) / ATP adenylyltransferase
MVARVPSDRNATHNLVLNKYPVISQHSILSTVDFKKQSDLLDGQDLDVTYACLRAWEVGSTDATQPRRLFAFFNSGEHSGASQPHRHLQLLPVEDMMDSRLSETGWQPLIDFLTDPSPRHQSILQDPSLTFDHFAMRIPANPGAGVLHQIYEQLYERASESVRSWNSKLSPDLAVEGNDSGLANISYNLAMTTHAMAICPRRSEMATLPIDGGYGSVSINGTILAGTLMVKEMSEWMAIRDNQGMIDEVLKEIGIPSEETVGNASNSRL